MPIPPPDVPYDLPQPVSADDVFIVVVGFLHAEPDAEILARSGDEFYRLYLPKHARVLRDFWKHIGVTDVLKLAEGAYQDSRGGCGPYKMSAMAIGEDLPAPEEEVAEDAVIDVAREETAGEAPTQRVVGTKVLVGAKLESPAKENRPAIVVPGLVRPR